MLYRLEIENFYSVRDPQVLDLRVSKHETEFPERFAAIFPGSQDRVAKAVALFGPNGSGKSTILKALAFIGWFVTNSPQQNGYLPCAPFNDIESVNRPIRLAVEFGGSLNLSSGENGDQEIECSDNFGTFRYELHLNNVDGVLNVLLESLRMKRKGKGRWQRVFERDENRNVTGSRTFSLAGFARIVDKIQQDTSVVATLGHFEHQASKVILQTADQMRGNILIDRSDPSDDSVIRHLAKNLHHLRALNRELQRIDLGIQEVQIVPGAAGPIAQFRHQGLNLSMPWFLQSHGTRSFIRVFPLIFWTLETGGVALIDELDQSIHPLILPEIIRWFYDERRNSNDAQIWMSCHAASLLDELTKEEIVFCEKDSQGRTQFYSLMDFETTRRNENIYKKYLGGLYGAVPRIG